ncbi:MAG: hypothetical protein ACJ71E_10720 [Nitrososphaeraceae archaeon]
MGMSEQTFHVEIIEISGIPIGTNSGTRMSKGDRRQLLILFVK